MTHTTRTLLLAWGACLAILALIVGCGSEMDPPTATLTSIAVTPGETALTSLAITPTKPELAMGTMVAFTAVGTFADGTTQDVTESITWTSEAPLIVAIANAPGSKGAAFAVDAGSAAITATIGDVTATTDVAVSDAVLTGIDVNTAEPWIAKGKTAQITALGIFTDGTTQDLTLQVAWASSDPIVVVSGAKGTKGLATGVAEGEATVSATLMGVTGTLTFTVTSATIESITVTPAEATIAVGTTAHFQAMGTLSDGSLKDLTGFSIWASSNDAVATVSNDDSTRGLATSIATGASTIHATYLGKSGATSLLVTSATLVELQLLPEDQVIAKGVTLQITAMGTFSDGSEQDLTSLATWGSTDTSVAIVSNAAWTRGRVTALAPGLTTISASVNGQSDATALTVSKPLGK